MPKGGKRLGAGRKATGFKTRCFTVTLPLEIADGIIDKAKELNTTPSKIMRQYITKSYYDLNKSEDSDVITDLTSEHKSNQ